MPNTTAYGRDFSTNKGSCLVNSSIFFLSTLCKNSLYHRQCLRNSIHFSVHCSFSLFLYEQIIQINQIQKTGIVHDQTGFKV